MDGSRLADVSETDTAENHDDLNRIRTRAHGKFRKKRDLDKNETTRITSLGQEEVPQDWTVFGELFKAHQAPLVGKQSSQRGRTTSSRSVVAASRPLQDDEEVQGGLNGGASSSRAINIPSRGKTIKTSPNIEQGSMYVHRALAFTPRQSLTGWYSRRLSV